MNNYSKYENACTEKSERIIEQMSQAATIAELEHFQTEYGISNTLLAKLSKNPVSQISDWKTGRRQMPEYQQQHFWLLIEEFKKRFEK